MAVETRDSPTDVDVDVAHANSPASNGAQPAQPYTVRLSIFEGPLDLLLSLIEKNQLEITAISLVSVTDQFIAYIRDWNEPPLPRMAEFVTMAARLLLIKSRSLLPRQTRQEETDDDGDPLDDAEQLRRHLIEYKAAREIARALRAREIAGRQTFTRYGRLMDPEALVTWSPPQLVGLNVDALAMVFRRVLAEKRIAEPEELPPPVVTIAEKIIEVEALLRAQSRVTLEEALRTADSRFAVVVTFLAVLELWHQARVSIHQDALFSAIEIVPGPKFGQRITATSVSGEIPVEEIPEASDPSAEPETPKRTRRGKSTKAGAATASS